MWRPSIGEPGGGGAAATGGCASGSESPESCDESKASSTDAVRAVVTMRSASAAGSAQYSHFQLCGETRICDGGGEMRGSEVGLDEWSDEQHGGEMRASPDVARSRRAL